MFVVFEKHIFIKSSEIVCLYSTISLNSVVKIEKILPNDSISNCMLMTINTVEIGLCVFIMNLERFVRDMQNDY